MTTFLTTSRNYSSTVAGALTGAKTRLSFLLAGSSPQCTLSHLSFLYKLLSMCLTKRSSSLYAFHPFRCFTHTDCKAVNRIGDAKHRGFRRKLWGLRPPCSTPLGAAKLLQEKPQSQIITLDAQLNCSARTIFASI